MPTFGLQLMMIRKQKSLTQEQLGHLIGMSQAVISNIETGRRVPSPETLYRLFEALGFPGQLLGDYLDTMPTSSRRGVIKRALLPR